MTYTEILRLLRQGGVEAAEFEARQILRQYGDVEEALCLAVERRLQGEPLQYIFGEWEYVRRSPYEDQRLALAKR